MRQPLPASSHYFTNFLPEITKISKEFPKCLNKLDVGLSHFYCCLSFAAKKPEIFNTDIDKESCQKFLYFPMINIFGIK